MGELLDRLQKEFGDENYRYAYAEGFLNASIAAQIKTLRGQMSQQELADKVGTKQSGISRLENVNYSAWKIATLRKIARAFGVRLKITFEEFGTLPTEVENFRKDTLSRHKFSDDPIFNQSKEESGISAMRANSANSIALGRLSTANTPVTIPKKPCNLQLLGGIRSNSADGGYVAKR